MISSPLREPKPPHQQDFSSAREEPKPQRGLPLCLSLQDARSAPQEAGTRVLTLSDNLRPMISARRAPWIYPYLHALVVSLNFERYCIVGLVV